MGVKIQIRRGNQADLPTLDTGEFGFTIDTERLYIGNPSGSGNTLINFGNGGFDIGNGADGYVTFYTGPNSIGGDNDLFWDRENNRLGIHTTTPTHELTIDGYIVPFTDNVHQLGTPTQRWEALWLGPGSLHIHSNPSETSTSFDWRIGIDQTTGNEGKLIFSQGEQTYLAIDPVTGNIAFESGDELRASGTLVLPELVTGPLSETGFGKVYVDFDDKALHFLDSTGVDYNLLITGGTGTGNVDFTEGADGYVTFFIAPGVIAGDNDFFFDRTNHNLTLMGGGKVGVGLTNPSSPFHAQLDGEGAFYQAWSSGSARFDLTTTGSPSNIALFESWNGFHILLRPNSGRVGINSSISTPGNALDVSGAVSIGSGFYGTTAPTDGLRVEGLVAFGTTSSPGTTALLIDQDADNTSTIEGRSAGSTTFSIIPKSAPDRVDITTSNARTLILSPAGTGVGISTGTTGVANKLDVAGSVAIGAGYIGTAASSNGLIVEGRVGIGISSATTTLHVVGAVTPSTFTSIISREGGQSDIHHGYNDLALVNLHNMGGSGGIDVVNNNRGHSIGSKIIFRGFKDDGIGSPQNIMSLGIDWDADIDSATEKNNFFIRDEYKSGTPIRFLIDGGGLVGIGTTYPHETLTVNGAISLQELSDITRNHDGYGTLYVKASDSRLYFRSDTGVETDLISGGGTVSSTEGSDGYVTFFTGANTIAGDNDFFWDRVSNSLGIGTSTPTNKLHVIGAARVEGQVLTTSTFKTERDDPNNMIIFAPQGGTGAEEWWVGATRSGSGIAAAGYFFVWNQTDSAARLVISDTGNAAIGTATPNEKLTVEGVLSLVETAAPSATAGYGKVYVKSSDSLLYFKDDAGNEYSLTSGGVSATQGSDGYLAFFTGANSIAGDNDLFWDRANNRLGIGTITPSSALHVRQDVDAEAIAFFENANAGTGSVFTIINRSDSAQIGISASSSGVTSSVDGINSASTISIRTSSNTSFSPAAFFIGTGRAAPIYFTMADVITATISTDRNFGIGTKTPIEPLTINGPIALQELTADAATQDGYGKLFVRDDNKLYYKDGLGATFDLTSGGGVSATQGADGYIAFFTGTNTIAGDNDFAFDRVGQRVTLNGGDFVVTRPNDSTTSSMAQFSGGNTASAHHIFQAAGAGGYTNTYLINDTAVYIGHNSSIRDLILRTNTLDRLVVEGAGDVRVVNDLKVGSQAFIGSTGTPINTLDVEGAAVIGAGDAGSTTAPTQGLLVQEKIAINTSSGFESDANSSRFEIHQTTGNGPTIRLHRSDSTIVAGEGLGRIRFSGTDSAARDGAYIQAVADGTWDALTADAPTRLEFYTQSDGATDNLTAARMVIKETGAVGIGTATPGSALHINTDVGSGGLGLERSGTSNNVIDFKRDGSNKWAIYEQGLTNTFRVFSYVLAQDIMIFNNDGHVGIGTSLPHERLTINGILSLEEQDAFNRTHDGYGSLWAKSDGTLHFTNDAGTDYDLTATGGGGVSATEGADGYLAFFTGANTIAGDNDLYWNRVSNQLQITSIGGILQQHGKFAAELDYGISQNLTHLDLTFHFSGSSGGHVFFNRSGGSFGAPSTISSTAELGTLSFAGYTDTAVYSTAAEIAAYADNYTTGANVPGRILFRIKDSAGNFNYLFRFQPTSHFWLAETTSTTTPDSGYGALYVKTDGLLYFRNDGGTEYDLTTGGSGLTASQGADGYIAFFTGSNSLAGDNDLFYDRVNSRLGINTSVPTHALTVDGYVTPATDNVWGLGTPTQRWQNVVVGPSSLHLVTTDAETTIGRDWVVGVGTTTGSGNFRIHEGSSSNELDTFDITPGGLVGFGTNAPISKLHAVRDQNNGGTGGATLVLENINAGGLGDAGVVFRIPTQDWFVGVDNDNSDNFRIASDNEPAFASEFTITPAGSVGIGTQTPATTSKLQLVVASGGGDALRLSRDTSFDWDIGITSGSDLFIEEGGGTRHLHITATTGRFGLGTSTPQNRLDVEGGAVIGASFSGTNTAPTNGLLVEGKMAVGGPTSVSGATAAIFRSSTSGHIIQLDRSGGYSYYLDIDASGDFDIMDNDGTTSRLHIDVTTGNVGIGTVTPDQTLHVHRGSAGTVTAQASSALVVEHSGSTYIHILTPDTAENGIIFGTPDASIGGVIVYNNSSSRGGLQFRTQSNITRMTLSVDGHLGLGTTTPIEPLTVNGPIALQELDADAATQDGYGKLYVRDDNKLYYKDGLGVEFDLTAVGGGGVSATQGSDGYVAFFTGANSIAGDNDLFWDRVNNRLGIGTIAPLTVLHVADDQGTSGTAEISVQTKHPTAGFADIAFYDGAGNYLSDYGVSVSSGQTYIGNYINNTGYFAFATTNGGVGSDKVTITNPGRVGIGTDVPDALLHVAGDGYFDGYLMPRTDNMWGLGTPSLRWRDLYLGPESLHIVSKSTDSGRPNKDFRWTIDESGTLTLSEDSTPVATFSSSGVSFPAGGGSSSAPQYTISSLQTSGFTAAFDTVYRCDPSGGGFTVTLPAASGGTGKTIIVKNTTSSTNTITIQGTGGELIDSQTTVGIALGYSSITFVSYGSEWGRV